MSSSSFNDSFEQRFFRSERFATRDNLRTRAREFERFHNANHRYRDRAPHARRAQRERRPQTTQTTRRAAAGWPQQGRVDSRFIRSDRKLRLLRRTLTMPERLAYPT